MATQLTLVNNVLRRLREDTVTSVNDNAYAQLVAMWVNDGIRDVSEAYDWMSLNHVINVDLVADTFEYDLTKTVTDGGNVDDADRVTTADSMLRFDCNGRPNAFIFDDSSDTDYNIQLGLISEDTRQRRYQSDRDDSIVDPAHFSLLHASTGDGWIIRLEPAPAAARRLRISFNTPQAELAIDGTDDATEVIVPNAPVEAYVHLIAANERGEEIGEPGNMLETRYTRILGGAIEAAMSADQRLNRYEFRRD